VGLSVWKLARSDVYSVALARVLGLFPPVYCRRRLPRVFDAGEGFCPVYIP